MKIYQMNFCSDEDVECVLDEKRSRAIDAIRDMLLGPSFLYSSFESAVIASQECLDDEIAEYNEFRDEEPEAPRMRLEFSKTNDARWEAEVETIHGTYYAVIIETEMKP